jgi:hypothetical protein
MTILAKLVMSEINFAQLWLHNEGHLKATVSLTSRQSPGRHPGWSGNDRGTTGNNRSTSVTLPAASWMIRDDPGISGIRPRME